MSDSRHHYWAHRNIRAVLDEIERQRPTAREAAEAFADAMYDGIIRQAEWDQAHPWRARWRRLRRAIRRLP